MKNNRIRENREELAVVLSSGEDRAEILCWEDVFEKRAGWQKSVQGRDRKIYDVNLLPQFKIEFAASEFQNVSIVCK